MKFKEDVLMIKRVKQIVAIASLAAVTAGLAGCAGGQKTVKHDYDYTNKVYRVSMKSRLFQTRMEL